MREMILNHASAHAPDASRDTIVEWLAGLAAGMAQLIDGRVAQSSLRTHMQIHEVSCQDGYSLLDSREVKIGYVAGRTFL